MPARWRTKWSKLTSSYRTAYSTPDDCHVRGVDSTVSGELKFGCVAMLAGYILGGGMGDLSSMFGLACDQLVGEP